MTKWARRAAGQSAPRPSATAIDTDPGYTHYGSTCYGSILLTVATYTYYGVTCQRCAPSVFSFSAAISACEKCGGRAEQAVAIFGQMAAAGVAPNDVTYNALISTLGGAGRADEAVALLSTMEEAGVAPP